MIDSILPVEEQIRRFQAAAGDRPAGFSGGASSRRALIEQFTGAIERRDTTGLLGLVVNRAEFAYLIYPTSPNAKPPYSQAPELVWLQRTAATDKGATRLLSRFGGKPLRRDNIDCEAPTKEGANTIWARCVARGATLGDTIRLKLFGGIVEYGGRYKFLSLSNGL